MRPGARPRLLGIALLGLALGACARGSQTLGLRLPEGQAEIAALAALPPLPRGWILAGSGSQGKAAPDAVLAFEWQAQGSSQRLSLGRRYLAPALAMADPRFDLSPEEALAQGLRELSTIEAPLRVPTVQGRYPGDPAWPFAQDLLGRIEPGTRKPNRAILGWWRKAEAALAGADKSVGDRPWRLGAVGDMQFGPEEASLALGGRPGLERLFGRVLPVMEAQGILVGNLEGAITRSTQGNPRKRFQFRMPPGTGAAMKAAGLDLVLFANNHVLDFGAAGFEDSLADLEAAGLPLVGAGRNSGEALATRSLSPGFPGSQGPVFIGFASYPAERYGFTTAEAEAGPAKAGINADEEATLGAIRAEAANGGFVVVLAHGGSEYRHEPSAQIIKRYRAFMDAGASLVLGSHPHLLQGVEARGPGYIAYSLGNFLFTGEKEPEEALTSALLSFLVYKGRVRGFAPTAVQAGFAGTDLDTEAGKATIEAFAARCATLATGD